MLASNDKESLQVFILSKPALRLGVFLEAHISDALVGVAA